MLCQGINLGLELQRILGKSACLCLWAKSTAVRQRFLPILLQGLDFLLQH